VLQAWIYGYFLENIENIRLNSYVNREALLMVITKRKRAKREIAK